MMSAEQLSLEQCQQLLQEIKAKGRHRLTGSEYKAVIEAVDRQRDTRGTSVHLAREVAALLAQHEGNQSKAPFSDPTMKRIFEVESKPATPPDTDLRMQDRVIAGATIFRSREYDHVARANVPNDRGDPGRETTAKRLDVMHESDGVVDRYHVYQVMTKTHTTYGSGLPSPAKDGDKVLTGTYKSLEDACKAIEEKLGTSPRAKLVAEQMQRLREAARERRTNSPRPA